MSGSQEGHQCKILAKSNMQIILINICSGRDEVMSDSRIDKLLDELLSFSEIDLIAIWIYSNPEIFIYKKRVKM